MAIAILQSPEWEDPTAEQEMAELLRVRGAVLALLEKARGDKYVVTLHDLKGVDEFGVLIASFDRL